MSVDGGEALATLGIHLDQDHVGDLVLHTDDVTTFALSAAYRESPHRPVLGQLFEDDLSAVYTSRLQLPPFFSNLLPEGRLRELVAARRAVAAEREFFLLAELGDDLPGAIRAVPQGSMPQLPTEGETKAGETSTDQLKFSLAGVQLKLSMVREGKGLTLPASGRGGDWIVKLPGEKYAGVPENEFATMLWARRSGLDVPDTDLIDVARLGNLPRELSQTSGLAFAVRRFDRPAPGKRIHIEDFAQIRNQYPTPRGKYKSTNYETVAKTILRVAGSEAFEEFLRRLAFIIVSANADAHIKNWSFIYRDRVHAQLSPAYDLVSTIEFIHPDSLALNLAKTKSWEDLDNARFRVFATRIGADPERVEAIVRQTVTKALDAWPGVLRDAPVSALLRERLAAHWKRTPLIASLAT